MNVLQLGSCFHRLGNVEVHLVSVEISVIGRGVTAWIRWNNDVFPFFLEKP